MRTKTKVVHVLVAGILLAGAANAASTDTAKCAAAKQLAAGKKTLRKIKCYSTAVKKEGAVNFVDPECLAKVEEKFQAAIAKAEAKGGCAVTGDAGSLETLVNGCVQDVLLATPTEPCLPGGAVCLIGGCCPGLSCVFDTTLMITLCL